MEDFRLEKDLRRVEGVIFVQRNSDFERSALVGGILRPSYKTLSIF